MTIAVVKGQRGDVTKPNPGLSQIVVGLGWKTSAQLELDTSAFLLGANGKVSKDEDLIFYNNPSTPFITFLDAPQAGDLKQFQINLSLIPPHVEKIAFTLTIYEGEKRGQSFNLIRDAYLRVQSQATGQEVLRYNLENHFSVETAVVLGELYRYNGEWKFNAIGSGFSDGLHALCGNFGIEVQADAAPAPTPTPKPEPRPEPKPEPRPEPNRSQRQDLNRSQRQDLNRSPNRSQLRSTWRRLS